MIFLNTHIKVHPSLQLDIWQQFTWKKTQHFSRKTAWKINDPASAASALKKENTDLDQWGCTGATENLTGSVSVSETLKTSVCVHVRVWACTRARDKVDKVIGKSWLNENYFKSYIWNTTGFQTSEDATQSGQAPSYTRNIHHTYR